MKAIYLQVGITLDGDAVAMLAELMQQVIEKGTARLVPPRVSAAVSTEKRPERVPMTPLERSQHAIFGGQRPPEDKGLLIDSRQAAKLLKVGERTLWRMWNSGTMPKPIRIGNAVRWSYEEIQAWVVAGCPRQEEWEWPKRDG
jgi:excisionase family DNA binding protein